jgi:hypothetical protein
LRFAAQTECDGYHCQFPQAELNMPEHVHRCAMAFPRCDGVAALEAFQTRNWLKAAFWLAIGFAFLLADNLKKAKV